MAAIAVEEFEALLVERHILQLQIGTEAVIPESSRLEILQVRVGGPAHFALAGMIFGCDDAVRLPLESNRHPGA